MGMFVEAGGSIVKSCFSLKPEKPLTAAQIEKLYSYRVPKVSEDGSCSLTTQLEKEPVNLAKEVFSLDYEKFEDLREHPLTLRLWRLNQIVENIEKELKIDWIGIYRKIEHDKLGPVLVKEAYRGEPSRGYFPLTEEFAKKSNNSWVAINAKTKLVQDVSSYEGPYYECSKKVQSECCLPIINKEGKVVGIIDAESWKANFFTVETVKILEEICEA